MGTTKNIIREIYIRYYVVNDTPLLVFPFLLLHLALRVFVCLYYITTRLWTPRLAWNQNREWRNDDDGNE